MAQKRRKRRRMLRERSPSPPAVQSKRQTPSPRLALSTRYSPDEMNNSPNFEEKRKFLTIFNLTHISAEKRKGTASRPHGWAGGAPRLACASEAGPPGLLPTGAHFLLRPVWTGSPSGPPAHAACLKQKLPWHLSIF